MIMTIFGAFALTRKDLYIKKTVLLIIIFTMQFGGGLIPTYIVVNKLLGNSIWTQLLPGAIATTNLIIMRTGFAAIPDSLEESAKIDGANDWGYPDQNYFTAFETHYGGYRIVLWRGALEPVASGFYLFKGPQLVSPAAVFERNPASESDRRNDDGH